MEYVPTLTNILPSEASLVNLRAPSKYFPFPKSKRAEVPAIPTPRAILLPRPEGFLSDEKCDREPRVTAKGERTRV
jgi:hypothetical protein